MNNDKQEELVTIVMPAYNAAEFISQSIESVLAQSYSNFELIIVDDNSIDSTCSEVKKFISDSRVKLLKNEINLGGAESRNRAIKEARGLYIAFLDSDDIWVQSKLEAHINYMLNEGVGFTYSNYQQFSNTLGDGTEIVAPAYVDYSDLIKCNFIGCLTVVYNVSLFGRFYFPNTKKRHDFALWLCMLRKFDRAYNVNDLLAHYRVHSSSLSANKRDAFQSYFNVLYKLERLGFIRSTIYTVAFSLLVVLKKKMPRLYLRFLKVYLGRNI